MDPHREYWEQNIRAFSGFYDRGSEEAIRAPAGLNRLYRKLVFPIERRYMRRRYEIVTRYLRQHVRPGTLVADIGCGSGIFTRVSLDLGARVYAVDYAQAALALAREALAAEDLQRVELIHADVTKQDIPRADLAIAIGVLPYVRDSAAFFGHVLPFTPRLLANFVDAKHLLNRLRRWLPVLDVRRLSYHTMAEVEEQLRRRGFRAVAAQPLATGFVLSCERGEP